MGKRDESLRESIITDAEAMHDLNNLLAALISAASVLRTQLPSDGRAAELASEIHLAAERATALVRGRLVSARKQHQRAAAFDVSAAVREMERLLRCVVGDQVALTVDCEAFVGLVGVDRDRLENVLLNLVANARDATPHGGHINVSTAAAPAHDEGASYATITVSDTGLGMTEDVRDRIFEPFFTTKALGHGTGLGLPSAQRFAAESGGTIAVHSELDHGTAVVLYLPRIV